MGSMDEMWIFQGAHIVLFLLILHVVKVVGDCTNPSENWPLTKTTCSVPIPFLQNTSSLCIGVPGELEAGIVPLSFSGSRHSYLDVPLSTTYDEIPEDFGFSAYIKPSALNGVIFHYQTADMSPPSAIETSELELKLVNGKLTVTRKFKDSTDEEIITDEQSGILSINQWYLVAFLHDISTGKAEFFLDGTGTSKQGPGTYKNYRLSAPGTLRVGSTADGSDSGFVGFICCVQFHANKDSVFDSATCLTSCKNIPKARLSFDKRNFGRFVLIGREVEPTDGHMTGGLVTAETWMDCGFRCLRDLKDCISFTVEPLTNGLYRCIMYDYIQFVNLVYASNKNYFRLHYYQ